MRISLFWNNTLNAEAMATLLRTVGRFDVVGHSNDVQTCLRHIRDRGAQVVLAEAGLLTDAAQAYLMGAQTVHDFSLAIVGETSEQSEGDVEGLTVISPNSTPEQLFELIRSFGGAFEPVRRQRGRRRSAMGLSAREREVVELVAKGLSNRSIAEVTGLSDQSVKTMVSSAMRRLDCENRTQLALKLTANPDRLFAS